MRKQNQGFLLVGSNLAGFILWQFFDEVKTLLSNLPLPLSISISIVLLGAIGYGAYLIYLGIKLERNHKPDSQKYSNHLKILMDSIKECLSIPDNKPTIWEKLGNEEPKNQDPDYHSAIKKSQKKIAIMQHLITDISNPANETPSLYHTFFLIQKSLKDKTTLQSLGNLRLIKEGFIPNFNREFNHIFNSIYDGEPIFGACDGCIDFYTGRNYEKIRNTLDNTGSESDEWYYSLFD